MTENVMPLSGAAAYVWLVPLLPFIAFLIISFVTRKCGKLSAGISIAALLASLATAVMIFGERARFATPTQEASFAWISLLPESSAIGTVQMGLLVDNFSSLMLLMVCFVGLCIQIYSVAYMDAEIKHFPTQDSASMSRFFGWLSLFSASMLGLVISNNLLQMYVFWELVGLCSYLLIGFWYFKTSAAKAAKKAFIVTRFGDLFFLMGILMLGINFKSFNFSVIAIEFSKGLPDGFTMGLAAAAGFLIFCGAVGKSAQFPLQIWLPDAMEGPTPVSALIHAATMVAAGVYLTARIFPVLFPGGTATDAAVMVAWIGVITAVMAATIAVVQNDIKRVLAYSTISQLGFMMAALGIGAYSAGSFHLITHAFFKALLFLGSGAVIVACHSNDMWRMGGLRKYLPYTWFAFLMGALALMGIPPFAGFWSKDEILSFAFSAPGGMAVFVLLTLAAFLTAFYVTRLYFITFEGEYRGQSGEPTQLSGPVPPLALAKPLEPSPSIGFIPAWTETQAAAQTDELPSACLGCHMEVVHHEEAGHHPHEVSPLMWVPLLVLATFAVVLGLVGVPADLGLGLPNWFGSFITTQTAHEHAFSYTPMIISVLAALLGIIPAACLYAKDAIKGEERLRRLLGPAWTFLQQKWYMDHLWAWILTNTAFIGAKVAAFIDEKLIDGAVFSIAGASQKSGALMCEEATGKVQHGLISIFMCLILLIIVIGFLEPSFAVSFSSLLHLIGK